MKKQTQRYTIYKTTSYRGISNNEAILLKLIKGYNQPAFSSDELIKISRWKRSKVHNTLSSMKKKGIVINIKRNLYSTVESISKNKYNIANSVIRPSYISFWTALSFYGFTEQQINSVQLVSAKQHKNIRTSMFNIEVVRFSPKKFYGYVVTGNFSIAEKEKAVIDSLFDPEKCGGFDETVKCIANSWNQLDNKKFIDYLLRFGNRSLVSRVGYIIEELKLKSNNIDHLEKYKSKSFILLDPSNPRTKKYNKKWRIIVNHSIEKREFL